jgi:3-oxoacyl-[acyl-carrier protein] reductase
VRLSGRTAFITGSSRGIGAAIARRLAADGAAVVLHASTSPSRAGQVAESIRAAGGTADVVLGELTKGEAGTDVVRAAFAVHGALDILVLNAGGSLPAWPSSTHRRASTTSSRSTCAHRSCRRSNSGS